MKKADLNLTIRFAELKRIVSGEKVEEYRDSKEYYHKIFKELDETFKVIKPEIKTLKLRAGYSKNPKYAIVQVKEIVHEQFNNFIPEAFEKGDKAYTIYIEKVLEHNLDL